MRESTGSTFIIYWICIFLIITFAFLAATLSYMKAYKINARIADAIEKFEGYNMHSNDEINSRMKLWAYHKTSNGNPDCPTVKGQEAITGLNFTYDYCVYEFKINDEYYNYGIRTYIYIELPIVRRIIKVPIYSETERLYKFNLKEY